MKKDCLDKRVDAALREDVNNTDRITKVLTRTVPWQFPGRLLQTVAELSPHPVEESDVNHAIIAVEYACLHQYLHAIPRTQQPLLSPAVNSPYAENPIAAILDGDLLQACAFSRLGRVGENANLIERYYENLSTGSIACYEQDRMTSQDIKAMHLAPLVGTAAYIGARLGGFSQDKSTALKQVATTLGETMPYQTPSGLAVRTKPPDDATVRIIELLDDTQTVKDHIEELINAERAMIHQ